MSATPIRCIVPAMLMASAAGCATGSADAQAPAGRAAISDWRTIATDHDRARLRGWRNAWMQALDQARAAEPEAIASEPDLFAPDRALPDAMPPAGEYRCRTIKLGGRRGGLAYIAYPGFGCRIVTDGDRLRFEKLTGSQRPMGTIYPDRSNRAIFLGTLMLGDETRAFDYGRDRQRDMIAIVERIGTNRWRMSFPSPAYESVLDVIELNPAE